MMRARLRINRRSFLIVSAAAGASVVLGIQGLRRAYKNNDRSLAPSPSPDVWLRIDPDNTVSVIISKSEMGQGVHTSLAMLVAEELDIAWTSVRVEQAGLNPQYGDQFTANSDSVRQLWMPLRTVGATARALLIAAAAQVWQVDPATCHTERGSVIHVASGRTLNYSALTSIAAKLPIAQPPPLKAMNDFALITKPTPRIDSPQVVDGSAIYGMDVRVKGMLYAVIARCPTLGGTVVSFDATAAKTVPGVLHIVPVSSGVAVVGNTTWAAISGRASLNITWAEGPNAETDSDILLTQLQKSAQLFSSPNTIAHTIEAAYTLPYLAHAPMEPMNCVAAVYDDHCEIWAPTQNPAAAQELAAKLLRLPTDAIIVHVTRIGGGFGRRIENDYVMEAVEISKAVGEPVQLMWTRDDDMRHDYYRPASHHTLQTRLDAKGLPIAWSHIISTPGIPWHQKEWVIGGLKLPYAIDTVNLDANIVPQPVPTGAWRSVHRSQATFATESFVDEIAVRGRWDPFELRYQLARSQRLKQVLTLAAEKSNWRLKLPAGWGRGMACLDDYGSYIAQVVELSFSADEGVRIQRVICAVDCGIAVNPLTVGAQIEGAVVDGLFTGLKAEITIKDGCVQQQNFDDYGWTRIQEMPKIEIYIVPSRESPGGIGELGYPAVGPAIANALFAATGVRVRRLPLRIADLNGLVEKS